MKSVFITGTDTGVGKTVLTAALVAVARARGQRVIPMKPVQTGCNDASGTWAVPDLNVVLRMANLNADNREQNHLCPYKFGLACSPHLAAARAGSEIRLSDILASFRHLTTRHEAVIVEGAGGVLVPLNAQENMRDLIKALDLGVVVVARPGLGTLNHTLLTVEALRASGIEVLSVVTVQSTPAAMDYIADDNLRVIAERAELPVFGPLPYIPGLDKPDFTPAQFIAIMTPVIGPILDLLQSP
ncbi:MAG: dethiobiotin synthase [Verrucomicrobia bacterium]|nr:dethiobiotin synthase [Verrucomicrobiota bacterium]